MATKASSLSRIGLATLSLALLSSGALAGADRASDTGLLALQDLVTRKANRNTRVFLQSRERRSIGDDILMTGRGYTTKGDGRGGSLGRGNGRGNGTGNARNFTYSVRIERGGDRARDIRIDFANGDRLSAGSYDRARDDRNDDRDDRDDRRDTATFTQPASNLIDRDGDVAFAGRSEAREVTLTILDRNDRDRVVATRRIGVRDGRWETNLRLGDGTYRARVQSGTNDRNDDTVNFRVNNDRRNDDRNDDRDDRGLKASFTEPRSNARERDGEIRFSGRAEGRTVELTLYRDGREVQRRTLNVRDDRWQLTLRGLREGEYRATIQDTRDGKADGRDDSSVRFTIDR